MFKKREVKGQLRKTRDEAEDEKIDDDEKVEDIIVDIKNRQLQRKKVKYDFSEIPDADSGTSKVHKPSEMSKSIQAMMGSQFAVKVEDSNKFNAHEKIMEKYINEKLGLINPTTGADKPDPVNTNTAGKGANDDNDLGLLGVGSGLAEVELPMKYKLANIQETEAARQNLLASRSAKSSSDVASIEQLKTNSAGGDLATFRYQKAYATPFIPASFGRQSDGKDKSHPGGTVAPSDPPAPSHPTVPLPESATDRGRGGARSTEYQPKSTGTRSDDFMVHQFKKIQQAHRR